MKLKNSFGLNCILRLPLSCTSTEDLSYLTKNDPDIARILEDSSLYMLVKRPCILFKDLIITSKAITGKIIQIGSQDIIEFELPIYQQDVVTGVQRDFAIAISYNNTYRDFLSIGSLSRLSDLDYIDTICICETKENGGNFIKYITPDAIIERYYNSLWVCTVKGNLNKFLSFEVLYVGEAVRSNIWKRLEKHETLQKVLSREKPSHPAILIAHEINVLFFEFYFKSYLININNMSKKEALNYFRGRDQVSEDVLYFDVEKAFIKYFKPKYNTRLYQNYPESSNGMMTKKYQYIQYSIRDPILLRSEKEVFNSNPNANPMHSLLVNFEERTVLKIEIN